MNKAILMGRMTRDPEIRYSNGPEQTAVGRFTLAVDRRGQRQGNQQNADFIPCVAEYGTFKMANNIAFNKLNAPDLGMIVAGAIISAIGMLVGSLWNKKRHNQKK